MRRPPLPTLFLYAALVASAIAGLVQLVWHVQIFAGRAGFPLDLEWMEGGMLVHAHRLAHGQHVYVAPSVDFIPFLYTPLYPALLALLSKVVPLGYLLARLVSLAAFTGALVVMGAAALRQGLDDDRRDPQSIAQLLQSMRRARMPAAAAVSLGVAGAGVVCAGFAFSGTFYDLARSDSLLLFLQVMALGLAVVRPGLRSAAGAGVLVALAFFTKQTASVMGIALGLGLLIANWKRGVVYGLAAAVTLVAGMALLQVTSHGWFWTYVFKLHQSHEFYARRAYIETPLRLWKYEWPVLSGLVVTVMGLILGGQWQRRDFLLLFAALAGLAAGCIGFGTQWAFENAFIPSVFFPVCALVVLGARQGAHALRTGKAGALALALAVPLALGGQAMKVGHPVASQWVPSAADRVAAQRFLVKLRSLDGEIFIPFHPYYAVLAGKEPRVHRMGVFDVAASHGRPRGLDEAILQQRFAHIVLDWKSRPGEWPYLEQRYEVVHQFHDGVDATRAFSGAETSPRWLYQPRRGDP